jgi:hypothetical protein
MNLLTPKECSCCGQKFGCGAGINGETCWCAALPPISELPDASLDCLCPECLARTIEKQESVKNEDTPRVDLVNSS